MKFTESTIQAIFGHEAAENEGIERLRQYYFKTAAFEKVTADLPLRILVGHKGIGKSALFTVAIQEDRDAKQLPILIRPDDIAGIGAGTTDFLQLIRDWKNGLQEILARKVLDTLGVSHPDDLKGKVTSGAGRTLGFLREVLAPYLSEKVALGGVDKAVVGQFLKGAGIDVYVDDIDRGWEGRKEDIQRISALINAMRDLSTDNPGLRFKLSLRSDVYFLVRTSDESTDKIEGSVVWYGWTNHEIFVLLVKRIETFFGRHVDEAELLKTKQRDLSRYLDPIMESRFSGAGKWAQAPMYRVLMSLIRKRPRDLVKLCTLAARHAADRSGSQIMTDDFRAVFEEYSQGRVQDTVNEFRSELPDIERLLLNMKPNKVERQTKTGYVYKTDDLVKKLKSILEQGKFLTRSGRDMDPKDLAHFLYKINFLTARKELTDGDIERRYFEENRYVSARFADFGYDWEIHPAYRWALQPDTVGAILDDLRLSRDDS
ncbi:MAG: hypothetical protein AMXMBFR57_09830 [Acidimicrobiia bacterium]